MRFYTITGLMTALVVSGCAVTQPPKAEEDYSAHHPAGSAPATATIQAAPMPTSMPNPSPDALNRQLQAMEAMHQKMQAAQTPTERAALMSEHMKLMQSGMAMMGQMRGTAPAAAGAMPGMSSIDIQGLFDALPADLPISVEVVNFEHEKTAIPAEWAAICLAASRPFVER